jgi:hypothetical protein
MKTYIRVEWRHDLQDEPVLYYSELGDDRYETRKVQLYRDGRSEWADGSHESDRVGLSEIPFPPLEEISGQPEFMANSVSAEEFEEVWNASRGS